MNEKTNKFLLFNFIHAVLGLYNKGVALFKLQKYEEDYSFFSIYNFVKLVYVKEDAV